MSSTPSATQSVTENDRIVIKEPGRVRCPRCPVELSRVEFVKHLWLDHQLVLDGQSVREPWRVIEDWLEAYVQNGDAELLTRCRAFAERLDPAQGLLRVQRLFLAHGIEEVSARQALLAEADKRRASLCPRCFAFVNAPEETPVPSLHVSGGQLTKNGYRVEIDESGLFSRLVVETPKELIYRGWEPGQRLTFAGAALFLASPFALAALWLAVFFSFQERSLFIPVIFLLLCSLGLYVFSRWKWQTRKEKLDRALNYAWTVLVPRLEANGFTPEDFAFLASLARTSVGHGEARSRATNLARVVNQAQKAVTARTVPVTDLAALWRLVLADKARMNEDHVRLAVSQAGRSWEGDLPVSFAENLLAHPEDLFPSLSQQTRLRILLCERAFEAGFEVRDLLETAKAAPFLGQAMKTSDANGLAGLRLLWSLRPRRPWDDLGPVETAFELAAKPGDENALLENYPDLLLTASDGSDLCLCGRGLVFQREVFRQLPRTIEVRGKWFFRGFELVIGDRGFPYAKDPEPIRQQVERWFRYGFGDWSQQLKDVLSWQSPSLPRRFRLRETYPCPECRRELYPRVGNLAVMISR